MVKPLNSEVGCVIGTKAVWLFVIILLFPAKAYANPIPWPPGIFATLVNAFAFICEVLLMAGILYFFQLSPRPLLAALFAGNAVFYVFVFLPLWWLTTSALLSEAVIVIVEAWFIKYISEYAIFQTPGFKELKWKHALLTSLLGNSFSFLLGLSYTRLVMFNWYYFSH